MKTTAIRQIGDQIANLTLHQAQELGAYLREVHGIEPIEIPTQTWHQQPVDDPKPVQPTAFDVVLTGYGEQKISVIRAVRLITQLNLRDAKTLVESAPAPIREGIDRDEAEQLREKLELAGGTVDIV